MNLELESGGFLFRMYTYGYTNNPAMTSPQTPDILRRKAQILQEMAEIDRMQRGTLSEQFFKRKKGAEQIIRGPYYVLQQWVKGKHCSQRVPAHDVPPVRSAIEGRE